MRHAAPGHNGNRPNGNASAEFTPLGAGSAGVDGNDRIASLRNAIEAIEQRLTAAAQAASVPPYAPQAASAQAKQAPAEPAPAEPASAKASPSSPELAAMQEQLNRLAGQMAKTGAQQKQPQPAAPAQAAPTQTAPAQTAQAAPLSDIARRQQALNANAMAAAAQLAEMNAPKPESTPAPNAQTHNSDLTSELRALRAELAELKTEVLKPVAPSPEFEAMSGDLKSLRSELPKSVRRSVRREVEASNGAQVKSLSSALEESFNAIGSEIEAVANISANTITPRVDHMTKQIDDLRLTIDDLPQTLSLSRLEQHLNGLSEKMEELAAAAQRESEQKAAPAQDMSSIESRLDEVARALVAVSNGTNRAQAFDPSSIDMSGIDRVEARVADLGRTMELMSQAGDRDRTADNLHNLAVRIEGLNDRLASFEKYAESGDLGGAACMFAAPDTGVIEDQLRSLNARIDENAQSSSNSQMHAMEETLRLLSARVEEASNVNSTAAQMSNLEAQIGKMMRQMSKLDGGSAQVDFAPVEARLGEIENRINDTQHFSVEAAQQAAQQAVALMGPNSESGQVIAALSEDLKALQNLAESGAQSSQQSVDGVQQTLQQIVERLNTIESTISMPPQVRVAQHAESRQKADALMDRHMDEADFAADGLLDAASEEENFDTAAGIIQQAHLHSGPIEAPSLDPTADMEAQMPDAFQSHDPEDNAPLEPGSGAPDLDAMVAKARARLQETKASMPGSNGATDQSDQSQIVRPVDDARPDAVAAARRALQATTAEMNAAQEEAADSNPKSGLASKLPSLPSFDFDRLKKPVLMGAAALLLSIVLFKGASMFMPVDGPVVGNNDINAEQAKPVATTEAFDEKTSETSIQAEIREAVPTTAPASEAVNESESNVNAPAVAANEVEQEAVSSPQDSAANVETAVEQEATAQPVETPQSEATPAVAVVDVPLSAGPLALVEAARAGDPKALFQIGMRYSDGNETPRDLTSSAKWFEMSAEKGFAPAQYSLGSLYEKGIGVERNISTAASWYEKASAQGNARAMHNLAVIYAMGNKPEIQPNIDKAVVWFQKASDFGIKDSQFNLGILYGQGMGVPQNLSDSYKWFALAAKSGDTDAAAKRDEVANAMSPDDLDEARKTVNNWSANKLVEEANRVAVPQEWRGKAAAPARTSQAGVQANVKIAQSKLNERGFDVGTPDGLIGPKTKRAIMEFQRSAGIPITGKVDKPLLKALEINA